MEVNIYHLSYRNPGAGLANLCSTGYFHFTHWPSFDVCTVMCSLASELVITSWQGKLVHNTGNLCRKPVSHRWIPLIKWWWWGPLVIPLYDVQFSCAITQPLLAHHWRVHQCLLTFIAPLIPWGVSAPGGKMKDHNFLNNSPIFVIESSTFDIFAFQEALHTTHFILKNCFVFGESHTIILWQDAGPCCEQTHAAFEVGLSLDQGQGVYSGGSGVDGSSQVRLCHTCIIDVMLLTRTNISTNSRIIAYLRRVDVVQRECGVFGERRSSHVFCHLDNTTSERMYSVIFMY